MASDWKEEYQRKTVSAEEAVKVIKSGDRVSFSYGKEPLAIGLALAARKEELKNVTLFIPTPSIDFGWYDKGWYDSFRIEISSVLPVVKEIMAEHYCDFVLGGITGITTQNPQISAADVLLIELSPPDEHGFCSFGSSVWGKKKAVQNAKIVIAEVNKNLIRTYGDNYIHVTEIDYFVDHISGGRQTAGVDSVGRKTTEPSKAERYIAEYVGSLVGDGDTLRMGVGSISECISSLGILDNRIDLGWHSDTTPPGIIKLVREGVITGKRKNCNTGKFVTIDLGGGSEEDMKYVDRNPIFELYDSDYVLDPRVISTNDNVVAINSAITIDLIGQIAAESVGQSLVGESGGQFAFALGAQLSKRGRFITILPSTANSGRVSRVVPTLKIGTVVTVPWTFADIVVTEYGIARLRGKTHGRGLWS